MERYIAVDSGKLGTKVGVYNPEKDITKKFSFKTKISEGYFTDDAIEAGSLIAEYDGKVYKIGNGAKNSADLNSSKKSEVHKICTLVAIAMCVSDNEVDDVHVAIGIPVKEYELVDKRQEYKDYILPDGEIEIKLKKKSEDEVITRKFNIVSKYVYPESGGALYINPLRFKGKAVGVIDIGNLNINCTCWDNFEISSEYSLTDELGGNILIEGLAQELSSRYGRVDEKYVLKVLMQPKDERKLVPNTRNEVIEKESAETIKTYLLGFVRKIKRKCDAKGWSLDFMDLVFIGGTAGLLENEIKEVFGENVTVHDEPEFVNVIGFLKRLCAYKLHKAIPDAIKDDCSISQGTKPIPAEKEKK